MWMTIGAVVIALVSFAAGYLWMRRKRPQTKLATAPEQAIPAQESISNEDSSGPRRGDETAPAQTLDGVRGGTLGYLVLNEPLLAAPSRFSITNGVFRIGRSSNNDLTVKDFSVSRHHAEVRMHSDGSFSVKDLKSMNGVYVNDKRVNNAALNEGDKLELGDLSMTFTFRTEPSGEETLILQARSDETVIDFDFDDKGAA
ncbi:MAG: pSer/pThr/pTyr-binding forkhead associated (FHA) protein [Gammaproteobacteria bacterium]|jgi:pSer/pThr/pTyr-binding forkhead associated (FHA) protein